MDPATWVRGGDLIEAINDEALPILENPLEMGMAHERSRGKPLDMRLRTERLGQDCLAKPRIAKNHNRLTEVEDLVLANGSRLLSALVGVNERSTNRAGYQTTFSGWLRCA